MGGEEGSAVKKLAGAGPRPLRSRPGAVTPQPHRTTPVRDALGPQAPESKEPPLNV